MAVATQLRPKTKTGQWSAIFPPDQVTQQQSAIFVKKLLAVAVSTVTYLRTIFPEHAFGDRSLEDLNLKILRDDSACPGACQVIKWMKGAFDALEKKYLRAMIIGMYTDPSDPDTALETYSFKFSYSENGPDVAVYRNDEKIAGAHTEAQTKRATLHLLRTILVLTQSLELLPDEVMMTMKLLYYDDVTPADYEPPGFKASDSDTFSYDDETINLRVGEVATPFHTVKLRITTSKNQFDMKQTEEEEKEVMENEKEEAEAVEGIKEVEEEVQQMEDAEMTDLEQEEQDTAHSEETAGSHGPKTAEDVPDSSPNRPGFIDEASQSSKNADDEENIAKCACECNEDDGLMIQCEKCRYWQHAVCFMITNEDDVPEKHFCNQCAEVGDNGCAPTDPYLNELDAVEVRATCLWRRTLEAVLDMERVTAPSFAKRLGVETGVAQCLISRLEKEGYCSSDSKNKRLVLNVNKKKVLKHGFRSYLSREAVKEGSRHAEEKEDKQDGEEAIKDLTETKKTRTSLQRKKAHKTEVEKLTEQAAGMKMSGRRTLSRRSPAAEPPSHTQKSTKQSSSQKRKASTLDGKHDFELSCSQEPEGGRERKRRKSSIVKYPALA